MRYAAARSALRWLTSARLIASVILLALHTPVPFIRRIGSYMHQYHFIIVLLNSCFGCVPIPDHFTNPAIVALTTRSRFVMSTAALLDSC